MRNKLCANLITKAPAPKPFLAILPAPGPGLKKLLCYSKTAGSKSATSNPVAATPANPAADNRLPSLVEALDAKH